jgi:uncharacterized membrane protein YheB (UPF0754 family)
MQILQLIWNKFIIYPFLGGFIGYITNWVAIKLLFRPKEKIFGIQGLIQKRKAILAEKISVIIREYLLNTSEIKKVVDKDKVRSSINKLVDKTLSLLPKIGRKILSKTLREITYLYFFDSDGFVKDEILELALSDADLENIIKNKILNYDIGKLEAIIYKVSSTEIKFILWTGGVIGFLIGIIQAFLPF